MVQALGRLLALMLEHVDGVLIGLLMRLEAGVLDGRHLFLRSTDDRVDLVLGHILQVFASGREVFVETLLDVGGKVVVDMAGCYTAELPNLIYRCSFLYVRLRLYLHLILMRDSRFDLMGFHQPGISPGPTPIACHTRHGIVCTLSTTLYRI